MKAPLVFVFVTVLAMSGCNSDRGVVRWSADSDKLPQELGWFGWRSSTGSAPEKHPTFLRLNTLAHRDITDRVCFEKRFGHQPHGRVVVEARLRIVSELRDPLGYEQTAALGVTIAPGRRCDLMIGQGRIGINGGYGEPVIREDPTAAAKFRTYRMEIEGDEVVVFVDGVERLRGHTAFDPSNHEPFVWWGDPLVFASGISDWEYVWYQDDGQGAAPN